MSFIVVNEKRYPVEIIDAGKRTSSVRLRNGRVVIRLSRFLRGYQRDAAMDKFLLWARNKLENVSGDDFLEPEYFNGGRVVTHNCVYEVSIMFWDKKVVKCEIDDNLITLNIPSTFDADLQQQKLQKLIKRKIMEDQLSYLHEVIEEFNLLHFRAKYKSVCFKDVKGRFGSCSAKGEIMLAYRLLFAPREVFKYVCVHELAHLVEFNHSKRFWALVAEAMPDYKKAEKWLKDKGWNLG